MATLGLLLIGLLAAAGFYWLHSEAEPTLPPPRVVPFTMLPGIEGYPALSPDGNQVAYVVQNETHAHLYVRLVDGGKLLQLTDANVRDYSPVWSPDGRRIAFLREIREV